jgi:hypothetical protein
MMKLRRSCTQVELCDKGHKNTLGNKKIGGITNELHKKSPGCFKGAARAFTG